MTHLTHAGTEFRLRRTRKNPFAKMLAAILAADARHRQRRHLAAMPPEHLRDIGLTPRERDRMLRRWDAPGPFWVR